MYVYFSLNVLHVLHLHVIINDYKILISSSIMASTCGVYFIVSVCVCMHAYMHVCVCACMT